MQSGHTAEGTLHCSLRQPPVALHPSSGRHLAAAPRRSRGHAAVLLLLRSSQVALQKDDAHRDPDAGPCFEQRAVGDSAFLQYNHAYACQPAAPNSDRIHRTSPAAASLV
eukprot:1038557-Pleurochrysis_carterae.AAC.1